MSALASPHCWGLLARLQDEQRHTALLQAMHAATAIREDTCHATALENIAAQLPTAPVLLP